MFNNVDRSDCNNKESVREVDGNSSGEAFGALNKKFYAGKGGEGMGRAVTCHSCPRFFSIYRR